MRSAVRSGGDKEGKMGSKKKKKKMKMSASGAKEDDDGCRPEGFAVKVRGVC